jgi:hypothetical protein
MSHRDRNPEPLILAAVIEAKGAAWGEETRKVAQTDAQRLLEALVAELGVEACVQTLDRQGLKGAAYSYLLKPLHAEAIRRRQRHQQAPAAE